MRALIGQLDGRSGKASLTSDNHAAILSAERSHRAHIATQETFVAFHCES